MIPTADRPRPTPRVDAQFDRVDRTYAAGDDVRVRYRITGLGNEVVRVVEHSIDWYTEGKGEEDLCVHVFERFEPVPQADTSIEGELTCRLPPSPLSYEGVIVKVRWCLRVRIFFGGGRDFISEHVFAVGRLRPARPVPEAHHRGGAEPAGAAGRSSS
jgi:hypothetical protein